MRTTLTLDEDVCAMLRKLQERKGLRFKEAVNAALREGLYHLESPAPTRQVYRVKPFTSRCLLQNVDNVHEVLASLEGDGLP